MTKQNTGFTIPELLISSAVMILVMAGVVSFYLIVQTVWVESNSRVALQQDARTVMEKMVRGVHGRDGIREASIVVLPDASTIQYTSGIDGQERSFFLVDNEIWYDPDTSVANDEFSIAKKIETFSVSNGNLVTINLVMQGTLRNKVLNVFLYTQVELRN